MSFRTTLRRIASIAVLGLAVMASVAMPSSGDLSSRYSEGQQRAGQLQGAIQADTHLIQGYEGTISSLQARLDVIQRIVTVQERLLDSVRAQLAEARVRLAQLEREYAHGRRVLAAELLAEYESPPPTIVGVVVNAHGFEDLLNRVGELRAIERANARVVGLVRSQRLEVGVQARHFAVVQERRQRATAAVVVERDQIAQLRLSIVSRELTVARGRAQKTDQLTALQGTLAREAAALDQQAAAAQSVSSGGAGIAPAGCLSTPYVPHGGSYGFFPRRAPTTPWARSR